MLAAADSEMSGQGRSPSRRNIRAAGGLSCSQDHEYTVLTLLAASRVFGANTAAERPKPLIAACAVTGFPDASKPCRLT
jgi:hypothetical protein